MNLSREEATRASLSGTYTILRGIMGSQPQAATLGERERFVKKLDILATLKILYVVSSNVTSTLLVERNWTLPRFKESSDLIKLGYVKV